MLCALQPEPWKVCPTQSRLSNRALIACPLLLTAVAFRGWNMVEKIEVGIVAGEQGRVKEAVLPNSNIKKSCIRSPVIMRLEKKIIFKNTITNTNALFCLLIDFWATGGSNPYVIISDSIVNLKFTNQYVILPVSFLKGSPLILFWHQDWGSCHFIPLYHLPPS